MHSYKKERERDTDYNYKVNFFRLISKKMCFTENVYANVLSEETFPVDCSLAYFLREINNFLPFSLRVSC